MRRLLLTLATVVCAVLPAKADVRVWSWCEQGGWQTTTGGLKSTERVQRSFPGCTITVYDAGTLNLATIFSDNAGTPKANPFTANDQASSNPGYWFFYGQEGFCYDVRESGASIPTPFTLGDICIPTTGTSGVIIGDSPSGQSFIILIGGDGANNTVPPFVCMIPSPSDSSTATCIFPCSDGQFGISTSGKPTADCTPDQIIQTGAEVEPCGANQQVQFNDADVFPEFGCDPDFIWDKFTNTLGLGSGTVGGNIDFVDGAGSGFAANLGVTTLTANRTLVLPNEDGTLCTTVSCPGGGAAEVIFVRTSTGSCATTGCEVTGTWSTAFADTSYTATCTVEDSTSQSEVDGLRVAKIKSRTASQIVVDIDNFGTGAITGTLHCLGSHDP